MAKSDLDVAVIGGGVSGTYVAWRLQQQLANCSIAVFEHSDRIGGRLYSRRMPGMPHLIAELGGMRYIPASQPLITSAVEQLGLETRNFPMGSPEDGSENNFALLRNRHLLQKEFTDPAKVPYDLSAVEQGRTPDELRLLVQNMLIPNAGSLSPDDWFDVKVFGRPLWSYGYWDLLYRVLSPEAYAFVQEAGGYDTNVVNGNSVSMLPIQEKGAATQFLTLVNGMQSLPETLLDRVVEQAPDARQLNQCLRSIEKNSDGYKLTFEKTQTESHVTQATGSYHTVQARHVVLAMPRLAIESIDWQPLRGDRWLIENIPSVFKQTAFKLFLGYEVPWWKSLGLQAGRSITDMPIRQTYYFGVEGEQPGSDPGNHNSLLMASYNDTGAVPFWKGLERGAPFTGSNVTHLNGESPGVESEHHATESMVRMAQQQLARLHVQHELPEPYTAAYHDWSAWPYGGGWHVWKAGYKFNDIMARMPQPVSDDSVYICGEAYSNGQGWVEGALQTAEQVIERIGARAGSRDGGS